MSIRALSTPIVSVPFTQFTVRFAGFTKIRFMLRPNVVSISVPPFAVNVGSGLPVPPSVPNPFHVNNPSTL